MKYLFINIYFLFCFQVLTFSQTEIFLKYITHTESYELIGETIPAVIETTYIWLLKDKGRIDFGRTESFIIEKEKIYKLSHIDQTYQEYNVQEIGNDFIIFEEGSSQDFELDEELDEDFEESGFAKMMLRVDAEVEITNEKKNINKWNCRKYTLELMLPIGKISSEVWVSQDIKTNYDLYRKLNNGFLLQTPGFDKILKELEKINGIHVLKNSTSEAMGQIVISLEELIEFQENIKESNVYKIPIGYLKD